jgi:hypothetical protein
VACRTIGDGLLIVSADTYWLSNEGLRQEPQAQLLSWAIGPSSRVLFDETHFGIQQRRGIAGLARQYGLHGFGAALAVLALLFTWRSAARLVPPPPPVQTAPDTVAGRAAHSALEDLFGRHLPEARLLEHCVRCWSRTNTLPKHAAARTLERLQDRLRAHAATRGRHRQLAACYRDLCEIVARKE